MPRTRPSSTPARRRRSREPEHHAADSPQRQPPILTAAPTSDLDAAAGADVLAVPLASPVAGDPDPQPRAGTAAASVAYGIDLGTVCENARFKGAAGSVLEVAVPVGHESDLPPRLVLVGIGDASPRSLRRAGAALARAVGGTDRVATTLAARRPPAEVRAFAEGFLLGAWTPQRNGLTSGPPPPAKTLELLGTRDTSPLSAASDAARATWVARDLCVVPSSVKTPAWLADRAVALAAAQPGVEAEVLDLAALTAGGFGGLLAVGRGSVTEPRLVTVTWTPPAVSAGTGRAAGSAAGSAAGRRSRPGRHVVLVGKGITFDTGGLSIKPSDAMVPMKTDMAGAAAVLATVLGAARTGVRHRVTGVLALAENAVGGAAYRPSDVVTVWGGTTVEIGNTDAEGRMVLADALAWADATLEPDVLIDVATLTGSASLGLGRGHAALFTADDALAAGVEAAAEATGERVWRMPIVEEYRATLDSDIADIKHIANDRKIGAGSVTAALFLREFAGRRRWAHLDIAGPARAAKAEHEQPKGATGFGARLLLSWLQALR